MAMSRWGEKRVVAVALTTLLLSVGCATNGDVSGARAEAEQARRIAEEANAKASAAAADAAAARADAQRAAQDAREANEKADRIFQRSLHK